MQVPYLVAKGGGGILLCSFYRSVCGHLDFNILDRKLVNSLGTSEIMQNISGTLSITILLHSNSNNIVAAFQGMHVSPAKHSYA